LRDWRVILETAVIAGVCSFLFFYGLGSFGLLGADEPRYAQVGSEMLARHDWIVPTLDGKPWLEKPPLLYWGEMASYALFGDHDWAARVPTSLLTTLMIFALWAFVRRRIPERALDAALIASSLIFVVGFARGASTDMPLTACFTVAMLAWMEWFVSGHRTWLLAFYAFQALGMLTKGPVSPFLAGIIIVGFALVCQPRHNHQERSASDSRPLMTSKSQIVLGTLWWPGILVFLVIAMPWYIAVQIKTGDFFRVFILEHNLARFGTNLYRHRQPSWYYMPVLLLGVMPWTAVLIAEAGRTVRNFRLWRGERPLMIFVALWCLIPVVFFSISQSKLPGYILPSVPAAVLMVVHYLHERPNAKFSPPMLLLHSLSCGAILGLVAIAPHLLLKVKPGAVAIASSTTAGVAVFALVALVVRRRGIAVASPITLVPVIVAVAFVVRAAAPVVDEMQSARPLAGETKLADLRTGHEGRFVLYDLPRPLDYGLHYYIRGSVTVDDPIAVANPYLLVTPRSTQLPATLPAILIQQYVPQKIDIYYVASRVPPKGMQQPDRVH
jgi:4-amino-4-deoxy-L-arabinose transferase-like glycosyltransferase